MEHMEMMNEQWPLYDRHYNCGITSAPSRCSRGQASPPAVSNLNLNRSPIPKQKC